MTKFLFLAILLSACCDPSYQQHVIDQNASNSLVPANPINYPVVCDDAVCVQLKDLE